MVKNINAASYECNILDSYINVNCAVATKIYLPVPQEGKVIRIVKTDSSANAVTVLPKATYTLENATKQVETATVVGTISTSGNAAVVVTSASVVGSPITLSVAVLEGDTASTIANKIRQAIAANYAISQVYNVSGYSGATVVLTQIEPTGNDSTLNISIDNDTCAGITTAATSTNTTAGVGVTIDAQNDYKSFIGNNGVWSLLDSFAKTNQTLVTPTLTTPTITDMSIGVSVIAGENIVAGDLVYPSGYDATSSKIKVSKADMNGTNPARVAWFVATGTIAGDATGTVYGAYELTGQNTNSASAVGDPVYLSGTAGGWTLTAPSAGGEAVQQVGVVTAKSATVGKVLLMPFYSKSISINTTE